MATRTEKQAKDIIRKEFDGCSILQSVRFAQGSTLGWLVVFQEKSGAIRRYLVSDVNVAGTPLIEISGDGLVQLAIVRINLLLRNYLGFGAIQIARGPEDLVYGHDPYYGDYVLVRVLNKKVQGDYRVYQDKLPNGQYVVKKKI
jgi:hypothetical protein